jgi:hypothetical protein
MGRACVDYSEPSDAGGRRKRGVERGERVGRKRRRLRDSQENRLDPRESHRKRI